MATNAALDELRRRGRRPVPTVIEASDRFAGEASADDPSAVVTRLDLDAALARLPEEFRAPIVLRDVAGCDYAEIASILEIPPGTVRSRIARGRRRLAGLMKVDGGNHDAVGERPTHTTSNRDRDDHAQRLRPRSEQS